MADLRNKLIGGFRVLNDLKLGSGAEGTVYKAVCEKPVFEGCPVGTVVALKTMTVQDDDHHLFARLQKRTEELVHLKHPNVVRYYGCFSEQSALAELHVVVLEFLDGETLKEKLFRHAGGLDVNEAIQVIKSVVAALSTAASKGIYHRDVKPANIFLCRDGSVKLIDFEVARQEGGTTSTANGAMVGTFDYMAPDFADPSFRGDEMSDVFSAGVVMHEALTGRTPYQRIEGNSQQANFAFLTRWARNADGTFATNPISISSKVRRLLSHGDEVLQAALSPDRTKRIARFSDFVLALGKIHFRELRSPGSGSAYQLLQIVGKGGFGEVFKARNRKTGDLVAIKHLLKPGYSTRFHREAKVMAKLIDPCFVRFVEFFETSESGAFIVMDFLNGMPGNSLRDAIHRAKGVGLDRKEVLTAFTRYAHALALMHAKTPEKDPIYHRDIKPSNLYFPENRVNDSALMDFGIAKDMGGTMTMAGTVPGTLDYMPPEIVLLESRGDAGVDVYALGLCLYEALSGKLAYPRIRDDKSGTIEFMNRATKKVKPNFSDSSVTEHPEILALLTEMTEPDANKRLTDARTVEIRLAKLAGIKPLPMAMDVAGGLVHKALLTPIEDDQETQATRPFEVATDAQTQGTMEMPADGFAEALRRERIRVFRQRLVRIGVPLILLLSLAAVGLTPQLRDPVVGWCKEQWKNLAGKSELPPLPPKTDEGGVNKPLSPPPEDPEKEYQRKLDTATQEADDVTKKFDDKFELTIGEAAKKAWLEKWSVVLHADDLDRLTKKVETAQEERNARDEKYQKNLDRAGQSAEKVIGKFGSELAVEKCKDAQSLWAVEWTKALRQQDFNSLKAKIETAAQERYKRDQERVKLENDRTNFISKCNAYLEIEPLTNRLERLTTCEVTLDRSEARRLLKENELVDYKTRLNNAKNIAAGTVANETDIEFTIEVEDGKPVKIPAGTKGQMLVFPKGISPDGTSFTANGYEPVRIYKAHIDGVNYALTKAKLRTSPVMVSLPSLDAGIRCHVDNVLFDKSRTMATGTHDYRYSKADCDDITGTFEVKTATPTTVPAPEDKQWRPTEGAQQLNEAENAVKEGQWDRAEAAIANANVVSEANRKRKQSVEAVIKEHKPKNDFTLYLRDAEEYFGAHVWTKVLSIYAEISDKGYKPTEDDLNKCKTSYDNAIREIDDRIKVLPYYEEGKPRHEQMLKERAEIVEWFNKIRNAAGK